MRLADKRKVIEVLLCAADEWAPSIVVVADTQWAKMAAVEARQRADRDYNRLRPPRFVTYTEECVEAAYRIIESSPTLRREWFGAR